MILFGKNENYRLIFDLIDGLKNGADITDAVGRLIEKCEKHKLYQNLWRSYIAWLIMNDENAFSLACEMKTIEDCTLYAVARKDAKELFDLFFYDFEGDFAKENEWLRLILNYKPHTQHFQTNREISGKTAVEFGQRLAKAATPELFLKEIAAQYAQHGVGMFGNNAAFYLHEGETLSFIPIIEFEDVHLSDLWGYELQKKQLTDNTEAFLQGKTANNVLLYGDSGTGKSTCVKAILNEYHDRGLRFVEIYKPQFKYLTELIDHLRTRNYKFVIYMDDLSFEDFEIEYKYLKAVIEGGLEKRPDNVLIYATSNRRHLIRENFSDRNAGDDIHKNDTMQEKLSLAERFGISINFTKPVQKDYFEMVRYLAKNNGIQLPEDQLYDLARKWGIRNGGMSGRVAQQFINHLKGKA